MSKKKGWTGITATTTRSELKIMKTIININTYYIEGAQLHNSPPRNTKK